MRPRNIVAIVLLLLPAALTAQRVPTPRIGRRGPTRAAPLPPQPGAITRELAYRRLRLSVETYPLVSIVRAPGLDAPGFGPSWTTFGMGTRADYRIKPYLSATLDMTSSFYGGPSINETAELGARLRPSNWDHRWSPFLDLRGGFMHSYDTYMRPIDDTFVFPGAQVMSGKYTRGFGAVGGAGVEFTLTRTLSATTAMSVMRNRLSTYRFTGAPDPSDGSYRMTSYRYTIGLRYNPVRLLESRATVTR